MESRWPLKQFLAVFIISLVLYIAAYSAIEHRRTRHGPWTVTFTNLAGAPALVIDERRLSISNVILSFPTQPPSVTNAALVFDPPREVPFALPFGQCVFMDTTFQPGTLVFTLFGHEIQLLPRTLTVDKREIAWQSGAILAVTNAPRPSQ